MRGNKKEEKKEGDKEKEDEKEERIGMNNKKEDSK